MQQRIYPHISRVSRGHTDDVIRLVTFLVIGAPVALANLICVWLFSRQHLLPYVVYITIATECSILCSFLLNDRFTFQAFASSGRPWYIRALRFHSVAAFGAILTIAISAALYHLVHWVPVFSQFIAIVIVTLVNFSSHHFWTYRAVRAPTLLQPVPYATSEIAERD